MKHFTQSLFVIKTTAVLLLIAACASKENAQPQKQLIKEQQQIEAINQIMNKAILENNIPTQLDYFADDIIIDPPLDVPLIGKSAVLKRIEKDKADSIRFHSFNIVIEDMWVAHDRIYDRGKWGMSVTSRQSKLPLAFNGNYFQIWRKQSDRSLKIEFLIYTLDFNPCKH